MANNQDQEIDIIFDHAEDAVMSSDDDARLFYFDVKNLTSKRAKILVSNAIYTTKQGEEIDQDVWLSGFGHGREGFFVSAGAFKKIGCVHHTTKLRNLSVGDTILLSGWVANGVEKYDFVFHCVDAAKKKYELLSCSVESIREESHDPPAVLAPSPPRDPSSDNSRFEVTHLVERLDLLEEKLGVRFEGVYAVCTTRTWETPCDYVVEINFDVVGTGTPLERSFHSRLNAYNLAGQLLNTGTSFIHNERFVGIASCKIQLVCDQPPVRMRLFPSDPI